MYITHVFYKYQIRYILPHYNVTLYGFPSLRHDAYSGCRWRTWRYKYID